MKSIIWVSFDLGIRGDYEGMYEFLATNNARECGDRIATFQFEFEGSLVEQLTRSIKEAVTLDRRSRVYVIFRDDDGKHRGRFIFGKRKSPPWAGYGASNLGEEDVGE